MIVLLTPGVLPDYLQLPGKWVGDDTTSSGVTCGAVRKCEGPQPSPDGRRWIALDTDYSPEGFLDDSVMMQICGARDQCDDILQLSSATASYIEAPLRLQL